MYIIYIHIISVWYSITLHGEPSLLFWGFPGLWGSAGCSFVGVFAFVASGPGPSPALPRASGRPRASGPCFLVFWSCVRVFVFVFLVRLAALGPGPSLALPRAFRPPVCVPSLAPCAILFVLLCRRRCLCCVGSCAGFCFAWGLGLVDANHNELNSFHVPCNGDMSFNVFELSYARPESMGKVSWDYTFKRPSPFVWGRNQSQLGTLPSYPMDSCDFGVSNVVCNGHMFANAFELPYARPESIGKVSWDYTFKRPSPCFWGRNQIQLGTIPSYPMDSCKMGCHMEATEISTNA